MPAIQPDLDNPSLRASSQVILDDVKLTFKTNHYKLEKLIDPYDLARVFTTPQ